ncbi:MAG: hypothetical protein RLZZ458_3319, partial [Planctomycetota bacterium]
GEKWEVGSGKWEVGSGEWEVGRSEGNWGVDLLGGLLAYWVVSLEGARVGVALLLIADCHSPFAIREQ